MLQRFHASHERAAAGIRVAFAIAATSWVIAQPPSFSAQSRPADDTAVPPLAKVAPDLNARLVGIERAQGVLFGALAGRSGLDEADILRRMEERVLEVSAPGADPDADQGLAVLGSRLSEVLRRTHAFHREVAAIFASVPPAARKEALDAAVTRYRSRKDVALPDAPKDMTILYDHPYTSFVPPRPPETEPRRELRYPRLIGFDWSLHWYELAVLEPLQDLDDPRARELALATVADRLRRKLSESAPPDAFPTELPLAPAIAPGFVALHPRAAAIVDNLDMMTDVIADLLVHPAVKDRRAAIDRVVEQFVDRQYRCVQTDEWIVVALRHSIFDQGGFALRPMAGYERNAFFGGHGQHYAVRRAPPPCDPEADRR